MKLTINLSFFLFALLIFGDKSLALTDYQIKRICSNKRSKSACIKNLKEKRSSLQKGNYIQIPVIPYKK